MKKEMMGIALEAALEAARDRVQLPGLDECIALADDKVIGTAIYSLLSKIARTARDGNYTQKVSAAKTLAAKKIGGVIGVPNRLVQIIFKFSYVPLKNVEPLILMLLDARDRVKVAKMDDIWDLYLGMSDLPKGKGMAAKNIRHLLIRIARIARDKNYFSKVETEKQVAITALTKIWSLDLEADIYRDHIQLIEGFSPIATIAGPLEKSKTKRIGSPK